MVMYDDKAPGVYIQEVPGGARPIQAVGTNVAGFVGVVKSPSAAVGEAIPINNYLHFRRVFHLDAPSARQAADAAQAALAGAQGAVEAKTKVDAATTDVEAAQEELDAADTDPKKKKAQQKLDNAQAALADAEASLAAAPTVPDQAAVAALETTAANAEQYAKRLEKGDESPSTPLTHAVYGFFQNGGGRCYVVNVGTGEDASVQNGVDQFKRIDEIAIVAAPGYTDLATYDAVIGHCEEMKDRVAILDAPTLADGETIDVLKETATSEKKGKPPQSDYASFYFPWLKVRDPLFPKNREPVVVPPAGHMAGIWARTDDTRGVHKAPANESVTGALDLTYHLTGAEQGPLNQIGVNCIRYFPDSGIIVWGARTVAKNPEWRYLNVRRLFNMIEESIVSSTRWIVFEPNDYALWQAIRRDVTAFLTRIWRTGALMGRSPEEAFFVKCDEETNPPEEIDAGKVNILIGIAPVKPAEFVVFQISQYESGSDVQVQGG